MSSFSIVTIVYNDISHIKETMDSVINQSYKNIEYILIDGWSSDGTKEEILKYIHSCANITQEIKDQAHLYLEAVHNAYPTLTFKFLSEKDRGIYDAMNKGIALATQEWINFMNCGDRFYNLEVLQNVANQDIEAYDVVYGDTEIVYTHQNLSIIKKAPNDLNKSLQYFGANLIHQSMFFKTQIHKQYFYDIQNYKIASDYDLICRVFYQGHTFKILPIIVSIFYTGGISDIYAHTRTKESLKIAISFQKSYVIPILIFLFSEIKKIIKLYLPNKLSKIILKIKEKHEC